MLEGIYRLGLHHCHEIPVSPLSFDASNLALSPSDVSTAVSHPFSVFVNMSGDSRPPKRSRVDAEGASQSDSPSSPQDFTHDPEFWFEDGTVRLATRDDVEFPVYQGLLADRSPDFRDLFRMSP